MVSLATGHFGCLLRHCDSGEYREARPGKSGETVSPIGVWVSSYTQLVVTISAPVITGSTNDWLVEATVTVGEESHGLRFRVDTATEPRLENVCDAFVVLGAPIAMATDGELHAQFSASPKLLGSMDRIVGIFTTWYPEKMGPASFHIAQRNSERLVADGPTLACFTGGVDSFYSLLNYSRKVSALLFVHGFDIPLSDVSLRDKASSAIADVAKESGINLVQVETNLRELVDRYLDWGFHSHGAALVAAGMIAGTEYRDLLVPSTFSRAHARPWGSHFELDFLWSTESLNVIHHGADYSRIQKITGIARSPIAQKHLRVCWQIGTPYNCEKCLKCVGTKIGLQLNNQLECFETFEEPLTLGAVLGLRPTDGVGHRSHILDNLEAARVLAPDSELLSALEVVSQRFERDFR